MWYKHLVGCSVRRTILYLVDESSRSTNKSRLITTKKQRGGLNKYNVLHDNVNACKRRYEAFYFLFDSMDRPVIWVDLQFPRGS